MTDITNPNQTEPMNYTVITYIIYLIVSIALKSYLVYAVYFSRFNIYGDQGFYCDEHVKQDWKLGKFFKEGPLNVSSDQFMNRYKR